MLESVPHRPVPEGMMANAMMESLPDSALPPKKTARFPRTVRLLRHADFERVYKEGKRIFSQSMTVFYVARAPSPATSVESSQGLRVGFTVGRALGGAVQRNRMKRRLREAVRLSLPDAQLAVDVVINPKKSLLSAEFTAILDEVKRAFAKIEQAKVEQAKIERALGRPQS
jgi:ribonuclease P protein component